MGRLSGISQSTISKIENGKRKIKLETLSKIAKALGVSLEQLTGESASSIIEDRLPGYRPIEPDNLFEVPVLGTIRAGQPIYAQENIEGYMLVDRSIVRVGPGEEVFYLRVTGDSMTPKYQPGDLVLIRRQPAVANGEVAAVIIDDENATLKKVYNINGEVWLYSTNPAYEPFKVSANQIYVLGKVLLRIG